MNNVAIAFLTKDRTQLTVQSIEPLRKRPFDLFWVDGSVTEAGEQFSLTYHLPPSFMFHNVRGGPDAAIVFALTTMLANPQYDYVGLCESDVLLDDDWFSPTMDLFTAQAHVGAVSPRCYEDRILIQCDGYAIMHNLGAGCVIFTRQAARIVLDNYRTGWTTDNRTVFNQRSSIDIGAYWAFRGNEHWLTADWHFDVALARHGLCSLALTPAKCQMIGQSPPLAEQGLTLVGGTNPRLGSYQKWKSEEVSKYLRTRQGVRITAAARIHQLRGHYTYFPHQLHQLGAKYEGEWRMKWSQGFGPFSWQASAAGDSLTVPLSGVCELLVHGGERGGKVEIVDMHSGYACSPTLPPEQQPTAGVLALALPSGVSYRDVKFTALSPGIVFYGMRTGEPQVFDLNAKPFDYSILPPPA